MLKFVVAACLCAAVLVEGRSLLAEGPPGGQPDVPPGPPPKKMEHSRMVRQVPNMAPMPDGQAMAGISGGFGGSMNFGGFPAMIPDMAKTAVDMMQQMMPVRGKRSAQIPNPEMPMPPQPPMPPMPPMPPIPN